MAYILEDSQTFLGVITTILLLCIYRNKSNFVMNIFTYIENSIQKEIRAITFCYQFTKITKSSDYKLLLWALMHSQNLDADLQLKCRKTLTDIQEKSLTANLFLTNWDMKTAELSNYVHKKMEIIVAPLYSFLFCICIFIIDGLTHILNYSALINIQTYTLFMSMFAVIYCAVNWFCFLVPKMTKSAESNTRNFGISSFSCITLLLSVFAALAWIFTYDHIPFSLGCQLFALSCLIGIIYLFAEIMRARNVILQTDNDISTSRIRHFIYECVLAACISAVLSYKLKTNTIDSSVFENLQLICTINIYIVALINGLVAPILVPLLKYGFIRVRKRIEVMYQTFSCRLFAYNKLKELKKLGEKIPIPQLESN